MFWKPDSPLERFPGRVSRTDGNIELRTSPQYEELDQDDVREIFENFGTPLTDPSVAALHGVIDGKPCTFLGLHPVMPEGSIDLGRMQAISFKHYRVSFCVLGLEVESNSADCITSARFSYTALKYWHRAQIDLATSEDEIVIRLNRKAPPLIQEISSKGFSFTFDISPELRVVYGELKQRNEAVVEIRPSIDRSLDWYLDIGYRFRDFFEIILGSSLQVKRIALKQADKVGWCRRKSRGRTETIAQEICIRPKSVDLAVAMVKWSELPEDFRAFERLLRSIQGKHASHQAQFLAVAQAIEAFHRLTVKKDAPLKQRLEDLIGQLDPVFATKLLGDTGVFEAQLRKTRNFFTHAGGSYKGDEITGELELFLFIQKAEALLRFVILLFLGLPADVLTLPIYQQSRRWS